MTEPVANVVVEFRDSDELAEQLRRRAALIGVAYSLIDQLVGWGEGSCSKYFAPVRSKEFTVSSLARLAEVLGLRLALVVDEELTRRMRPSWEKRDARKIHGWRSPSLGPLTLRRVLPSVAAEMGRRGGQAWAAKTSPEQRRLMGRRGAAARWGRRTSEHRNG
jgi:hypothetical protein